jgi:hypothetical protein
MHYIAYYRVSTDRQGKSGLGFDIRAALAEEERGGEFSVHFPLFYTVTSACETEDSAMGINLHVQRLL